MKYLNKPVAYLENDDISTDGSLNNPLIPTDKPVIIMLQSSWCPHCTSAKPAFQQFANENVGKVFCATIQSDGDRDSEKELGKRISSIKKGFRGFPDYLLYKNGKLVPVEIKGRSVKHLEEFSKM
jgi:thiol-disulfide isomerase/thioredoxin